MAKKQIESKVLTVSEIAEKAGVSRNKVWSYIRRKKIEPVEKKNKVFKFNASIVLEIKRKQEKKQVKNISTTDNSAISSTVLEILQKQLEIKDDQIRKQQNRLSGNSSTDVTNITEDSRYNFSKRSKQSSH